MARTLRPILLWGRGSSSNTQKVLWVLEEAGVPYSLIKASARLGEGSQMLTARTGGQPYGVVDTPEYLKMNPHGRVPTISDPNAGEGTNVVFESNSIVRYLARSYLPSWQGETPLAQARAEMWMDWVIGPGNYEGTSFPGADHHLIDQVARMPPSERDMALVEKAHSVYVAMLSKAEAELATHKYIAGDHIGIGDVPLATQINRWSLCLHALRRDGVELPVPRWPSLSRYYQSLLERPAFVKGVYEPEAEHQGLLSEGAAAPLLGLAGQERASL
mmetsp:Transcript_5789/g.11689  ORF Transcript_5789/g.11689 Transcript_5789/m.11689 type:complete len:274 (-) Transcript_5789:112-933(-)